MLGSSFPLCPLYLGNLVLGLGPLLITQILFKSFVGLGMATHFCTPSIPKSEAGGLP